MANNVFQMAKQAMEMRTQMKRMQKELESQTAEFENAGVKVVVRGDMTLMALTIDPDAVDITRLERLERTVIENTNKALRRVKDQAAKQMSQMTKGMGLDGLMGGMGQ